MRIDRRTFVGGTAALGVCSAASAAATPASDVVRPEDFGAKGDGITNDTAAFAALSAHINAKGGGTVVLKRATYLVGQQVPGGGDGQKWAFGPAIVMEFNDLARPLVIRGNGATLKCAAGLRYGTFDPISGEIATRPMPNLRRDERASPYRAMIYVSGCRADVEISDIELDGNVANLRIGGLYGDVGRQIPATGLILVDNAAREIVRNVHTHHHGLDGVMIDGVVERSARSRLENVVSEYNGRQGVSITGGRGYDFLRCKFNHTGRSVVSSPPGAGVDIEAEGEKTNRDLTFTDCEFVDNRGCGMVADSGDSAGAVFRRCLFVGTTSWSAWPKKPYFAFHDCTFVGSIVHALAAQDPREATRFHGCRFSDDPAKSPTGKVFLSKRGYGPIANLNERGNPHFANCSFLVAHGGLLPWSVKAVYEDCVMRQSSARPAYPRGTYLGRCTIDGNAGLGRSRILGQVILNGKMLPRTG